MTELSKIKDNITIPNILSTTRIILIVPFIMSVINVDYITAGIVLTVSGVSDLLDGIIARELGQVTRLGKMLDPIADKLTLMAVMVCVGVKFPAIFPFMIILIIKEILMLAAGALLLRRKKALPAAKWYGKVATVIFYVSVITVIGLKAVWDVNLELLNLGLMSLTAIFMAYALFRYSKIFVCIIKNDKSVV